MKQAESLETSRLSRTRDSDRPITTITSELFEKTGLLVRKELELAIVEIEQKALAMKADLAEVSVGGAVLYAGVLALVSAAILALALAIAPWLAALIIGVVVTATGYGMLHKGTRDLAKEPVKPETTVRSVQRTAHQLKEAVK